MPRAGGDAQGVWIVQDPVGPTGQRAPREVGKDPLTSERVPMAGAFDLIVLGSTSELFQALFKRHEAWFKDNVRKLVVSQRGAAAPATYAAFKPASVALDCSDAGTFRAGLDRLVAEHASDSVPVHVFPTYGRFSWNHAPKNPVFSFSNDGLQVNLNARLQVLDAFRKARAPVTHHLLGSLFSAFPYTGDYALGMWYINQVPFNAQYADLDVAVYNLGGMKTRFWDHARGGDNPFTYKELPLDGLFRAAFTHRQRGVVTLYPSVASRVACFLGRRGVRVL